MNQESSEIKWNCRLCHRFEGGSHQRPLLFSFGKWSSLHRRPQNVKVSLWFFGVHDVFFSLTFAFTFSDLILYCMYKTPSTQFQFFNFQNFYPSWETRPTNSALAFVTSSSRKKLCALLSCHAVIRLLRFVQSFGLFACVCCTCTCRFGFWVWKKWGITHESAIHWHLFERTHMQNVSWTSSING